MTLTMSLPARELGAAWLNTALVTGQDDSRPVLYRTLLIEVFKTGVQLISTDGVMMFGSFVPTERDELTPPPSMDELPLDSYLVIDEDRQGLKLLRYAYDEAKAAIKNDYVPDPVQLRTKSGEDPRQPTIDTSLDRELMVISCRLTTVALPIFQGGYLDWREFLRPRPNEAIKRVGLNPYYLGLFGKLREFYQPVAFSFTGDMAGVMLSAPGSESYFFGALMPARLADDE